MSNLVTISVYAENVTGVLHRIATSFTKRKINIETLTVSETSEAGVSLFTITVQVDPETLEIILKQVERIVEVHRAFSAKAEDRVSVEVALVRVKFNQEQTLSDLQELLQGEVAKIVHEEADNAIVEFQGDAAYVKQLYQSFSKFEVLQFVTSGPIALTKKFESIHSK